MIAGSGGFQVIDGSGYIRQRIALALGEPYGDDPFQPQWGSTLESYIGTPIDDGTPALISSEVARVMDMLRSRTDLDVQLLLLHDAQEDGLSDETVVEHVRRPAVPGYLYSLVERHAYFAAA